MPKFTKGTKAPPPDPVDELAALLARCDELKVDIDAYVDRLVDIEKANNCCPAPAIRRTITRGEACVCATLRRFVDEAEVAKVKASQIAAAERAKADASAQGV